MTKNEQILFMQIVGIRYLIANGFQLVADGELTTEEWKKLRLFSKEKIDIIADRALEHLSERIQSK